MNRTEAIISRFPSFYPAEKESLFYKWIDAFATQLDEAEEALLGVMHAHWVQTADNKPPSPLQKQQKGDLDKILTLYLESLGGTALIKQLTRTSEADDDLYRNRILKLIHVLKSGPITKQGIRDIIAANIGIAKDIPYADEATKRIQIVEFLAEMVEAQNLQNQKEQTVSLFKPFTVKNVGSRVATPIFRIQFNSKASAPDDIAPTLMNVKIRNIKTDKTLEYKGETWAGDRLFFLPEGALLNGQKYPTIGCLDLPTGDSTFRIEANWGTATTNYPVARFDDNVPIHNSVFTNRETFAKVELAYEKLTYGAFRSVVPWDIAGFSSTIEVTKSTLYILEKSNVLEADLSGFNTLIGTYETLESFYDAFKKVKPLPEALEHRKYLSEILLREADLKDKYARFNVHPRLQLAAIVERVKAAGVYSDVVFEKRFGEYQQLEAYLKMDLTYNTQIHELDEKNLQAIGVLQLKEEAELKEDKLNFQAAFDEQQALEDSLKMVQTQTQIHEMEDKRFNVSGDTRLVEKLELEDSLKLSAIFDFTYFDSLNAFALTADFDFTYFDAPNTFA